MRLLLFLAVLALPAPDDGPTHVARLVDGTVVHCTLRERRADRVVVTDRGHARHFLHTLTEWFVPAAEYRAFGARLEAAIAVEDADTWGALGAWCAARGMHPEAKQAFEAAIARDADHAPARAGLAHRRIDGRWLSEPQWRARDGMAPFAGRWIPAEDLEAAHAAAAAEARARVVWIDWTWSFADDLDPADHPRYRRVVAGWAKMLWQVGEGNFALRSVSVVDRTSEPADMHTPAGAAQGHMVRPGSLWARVVGGRVMEIPGYCDAYTWLHELGHRLFDTPEEYDTTPGCPCVESTGANGGAWRWCDELSHIDAQRAQHLPCWEGYILAAYPNARHPGPGGEQPTCAVTFTDR